MNATSDAPLPYPAFGTILPTGNADFESLRLDEAIYVDKTDAIFELTSYKKVFLSRPRRFGKTLLVSTLETLFRDGLKNFGGVRRLYRNGEYTYEPFKIAGLWQRPAYPVVRLDFSFLREDENSMAEGGTLEDLFREEVVAAFEKIGFRPNQGSPWLTQLKNWLLGLAPSSVVLLVDEYDAGLGSRLGDSETFSRVLSALSAFFSVVKAATRVWKFVFITGIARFGKASVFSSMNDLEDITFMPQFGTLLGYTEQEIQENFAPYLEKAAHARNIDVDGLLDGMRRNYDGFCFDEIASTHVYAPWSVLKFLRTPQIGYKNYWIESSGNPSALHSYIEKAQNNFRVLPPKISFPFDDLKSIMDMKDLKQEMLLNQAGYLTIVGIEGNDKAILSTPNIEVASTLSKLYLSKLLSKNETIDNTLSDVYSVLQQGNPEAWVELLNTRLARISYHKYPVDSEASVQALAQMLILGRGIECEGERANAWGRSDLEVRMPNVCWVMEFKFVGKKKANQEGAAKEALSEAVSQVRRRKYAQGMANLPLVRVALVFSEAKRQIVEFAHIVD